jgi:2-haloacid dehalogenase
LVGGKKPLPRLKIKTLTFDVFGTILNIAGSITPVIEQFLSEHDSSLDAVQVWKQFRTRQRIEQYQDNLLMLGHSGYLEAVRRAFLYTLRTNKITFTDEDIERFLESWKELKPFEDAEDGLTRLREKYQLVVLSNGEKWFLQHLAEKQIGFEFDKIISVQMVGVFKPHPAVYRTCARVLNSEPVELMMISSNSFDVMGARACGFQAAWVRRHDLPYEETTYRPTIIVRDFHELATSLSEENNR